MATRYKVNTGDTLLGIAKRYNTNVNNISGYRSGNAGLIFPGEELTINDPSSSVGSTGSVSVPPKSISTLPPGTLFPNGLPTGGANTGSTTPSSIDATKSKLSGLSSRIGENATERAYLDSLTKSFTGSEESLQAIRDDLRSKMMERVNAINSFYNSKGELQRDENNRSREAARALALSSGLAGSNFATSQDIETQKAGDKMLNNLEAERLLKINEVYNYFDDAEQKRIDSERARLAGNREEFFKIRDDLKTSSQNSIKSLGQAGVTWDEFKNADSEGANALLKDSGLTEAEVRAIMVTQAPEGTYLNKDKPDIRGNQAIFYKQIKDPRTGKTSIVTEAVDIPNAGKAIEQVSSNSSGIYVIYKDGTYTKLGGSGTQNTAKKSGAINVTPQLIQEANQTLANSRGGDGYVNSKVYQDLFNDWVKNGGIASDFTKYFNPADIGVNPNDPTLPENLKMYRTVYYNNNSDWNF